MTDKKTIWHEPTEKPELFCGKDFRYITVQTISGNIYFDSVSELSLKSNDGFIFLRYAIPLSEVSQWCYTEDYIKEQKEQSNKIERLESEVSRYKNALEVARDIYKSDMDCFIDDCGRIERKYKEEELNQYMENYDKKITKALKEIDSIKGE